MAFNWQPDVYHKPEKMPQSWRAVRGAILRRDGYKCFRCDMTNRRSLTVHHIIPRTEGGTEDHDNLITLCNECHNIVEDRSCRSLLDIEGTIEPATEVVEQAPELVKTETFERPAWHAFVYGGKRG